MALFEAGEQEFAEAISRLTYVNPFLPDRIGLEQSALGRAFERTREVWHVDADLGGLNPNLARIEQRLGALLPALRDRLAAGASPSDHEIEVYEDLVLYTLYARYADTFMQLIEAPPGKRPPKVACYDEFAEQVRHYLEIPGLVIPTRHDAPFLFAYAYQTRRAFHHTFRRLYGSSLPAAQLRAAVWESVFSHDRRRYRRALFEHMHDLTTLITGPSGTGKELVARAIALSRFVPFDAETCSFTEDPNTHFHPVNLSALSPTLIESELFGHARGAFTGAIADRSGWLEACGMRGTVFLDEVGELDPQIQVKLLRVLQTRSFQRLGETGERRFEGKIIAATHRDLAARMQAGAFREDFYYRLCSDLIRTPSLHEQLAAEPADLRNLLLVITRRSFGAEEAEPLAREVEAWILEHLGADYSWPGNVRELEQCVRNVLLRREYRPPRPPAPLASAELPAGPTGELAGELARGSLSMDTLLGRYVALVYHQTGSYEEAARRLGIDRRTVKAKLDAGFLAALEAEGASA